MVPNDWEEHTLKSLCSKVIDNRGKTPPLSSNGIPLIEINAIVKGMHPDLSKVTKFVSKDTFNSWFRNGHTTRGDILVATVGNAGVNGIVNRPEGFGAIAQNLVGIRCHQTIDSSFLYYSMNTQSYFSKVKSVLMGAVQPSLKVPHLLSFSFLVPPLPEQRKIAKILSTWDKAISTTEKLIETSKQQKKALMQQLLTGKKRLVNPETGKVFEGEWEEVKLSYFFDRVTEKNKGQSTNVVTISAQHGLIRQEEFFKKSVASETLDNYFILRKGQFAYNKSYSNGYPMGAIKRLNRYEDAVVTSLYICFELKNEQMASSCFMEQYFESGLLNRGLTKVAAEGGRAHGLLNVKPADFMALAIIAPQLNEQQKIASVLTAADKEIEVLETKLAHLKQEKKALMQQLLTGKRRVKVDEEVAA